MSPRVSDEYLAARREEIIRAAEACFARNGIHGTTLEDIRNEAGVSRGAVYHYFKSKEDIVDGIRERSRSEDRASIEDLSPGPRAIEDVISMFEFAAQRNLGLTRDVDARVALFLWAEALINERIMASQMLLMEPREYVAGAVRKAQEQGDMNPDLDPAGVTDALLAFALGLTVLGAWYPDWDPTAAQRAFRSLLDGEFRTRAQV